MKNRLLCVAAALATLSAAPAFAQTYSGGGGTYTGLGADQAAYPGTLFDIVDLAPITGVYSPGGPGTYAIDAVTFTAGINRNDAASFTGVLNGLTGTFGGNSFTYSVNYAINISYSDTITLGGNSFLIGGKTITINPLTLNSGGAPALGTLTVSVPEPATWAMMVLGFGMVGFGLRARRKQSVRVTFA